MSADNGVYVLESLSPNSTISEYRVTYAMAIDNLWFWVTKDSDFEVKEGMNPKQIKNYFGNCTPFKTRQEALAEADRIHQKYEWTEYGIQFLPKYEKIFPE